LTAIFHITLDWIEDPELRRRTSRELNKGESRNSLARAVFIHRLGEIRDRTYENQQHRASG
jgi:TnpA family transposase